MVLAARCQCKSDATGPFPMNIPQGEISTCAISFPRGTDGPASTAETIATSAAPTNQTMGAGDIPLCGTHRHSDHLLNHLLPFYASPFHREE